MTDNEALEHLAKLAISEGINYPWLQRFVLSTATLQSRYAASVREANLLRSEACAWRRWKDGDANYVGVAVARHLSDQGGCFHCVPLEEVDAA